VVGVVRYGLYPVASMDEMVQDVGAAAAFVLEGGLDLERVLPPPLPPGTKWTRCVPHPVLIGHAASLSQVLLVSGPYDIPRHYEWERGRGVHLLSPMHVVAGSRCDSCVLAMTYVC
jgi:hypothetical protein